MRFQALAPAFPLLVLSACGGTGPASPAAGSAAPAAPVQRLLAASRDFIETFTVDSSDGRLGPVERLTGVSPSIWAVAHPSGDRVYVATVNGIEGFRVNAADTGLTALPGSPYPSTTRVSSLTFGPAGSVLYARRPDEILSLRVDASGALAAFSATAAPTSANPLAVEPGGRYAYSLVNPFMLAGFRIETSGALTGLPGSPYPLLPSGVNPTGLRMGRAGNYFYFASQGDGRSPANLQVYTFDAATGLPEPVVQYATPGDAYPAGFEVSRSGATYYVAYRDNQSGSPPQIFVQAYAVDGASGRLGALARLPVGRAIFAKLKLSSDERSLFVTLEPASAAPPIPPTGVAVVTLGPAGELGAVAGPLQSATSFTHSLLAIGPQTR